MNTNLENPATPCSWILTFVRMTSGLDRRPLLEPCGRLLFSFRCIHPLDTRGGRALMAARDHRLHLRRLARDEHLHAPVAAIADPAAEAKGLCRRHAPAAIEDALDPAGN